MLFNLAPQSTTPRSTHKRPRQLKCSFPRFIQIFLQQLQPCTIIKLLCRHSSNSCSNKLELVVVIHQMLVLIFSLHHLYFSSNNNRRRIPVPLLQLASVEALLLPNSSESLCMVVFFPCVINASISI